MNNLKHTMSWLDWKLGARMLARNPGLSIIGGITLAATIGLGAAWYEVTRQLVEPTLPFEDGDRIVRIDLWDAASATLEPRALYDFAQWRDQLTSIEDIGAYQTFERNLITSDGGAEPTTVAEISASAFPLTQVEPLLGRTLAEEDADAGAANVVVLGYDIWQSRFHGAANVIGASVRIGRTRATVVGVMPAGFRFPRDHDMWLPFRVADATTALSGPAIRVFGRLADGASLETARAELNAMGQRLAAGEPATHAQLSPRVSPFASSGPALTSSRLLRLSNIVAWLLLSAACASIATLMFARTATREAEILVRNALGASRSRVMMQLFVEAFVLCVVATIVGLVGVHFALTFTTRMLHAYAIPLPFWWQLRVGPATIAYASLLALAGAALLGLLPAVRATGPRLQPALAKMSSGGGNIRFGGVWSVMIVLQVMFAALCLPVGLTIASSALEAEDPSTFPANEYLTFRAELDPEGMPATDGTADDAYRAHMITVFAALERQLQAEPSVVATTYSNGLPGAHYPLGPLVAQREDGPLLRINEGLDNDRVWIASVGVDYFDTFRMPLVTGRMFHSGDVGAQNRPVIISEALARDIGGNPLGVRLRLEYADDTGWNEVVGVVRSNEALGNSDFMFFPVSVANASPAMFALHMRGQPAEFAGRLRTLAAQVEPGLRVYDVRTLEEVQRTRDPIAVPAMTMIAAITLLALALSAAGLYSLMSVSVTRRTREIGIRVALGASPRALLGALFARAAAQIGVGIVIGVGLCRPLMMALGNSEPWSEVVPPMLAAAACMMLVGLIACGVPARRALRVHPTNAMRHSG